LLLHNAQRPVHSGRGYRAALGCGLGHYGGSSCPDTEMPEPNTVSGFLGSLSRAQLGDGHGVGVIQHREQRLIDVVLDFLHALVQAGSVQLRAGQLVHA
jgi:hypothetical protein